MIVVLSEEAQRDLDEKGGDLTQIKSGFALVEMGGKNGAFRLIDFKAGEWEDTFVFGDQGLRVEVNRDQS